MSTESGFYVMPAASQSEPQDAYGEAEKTNTEGCPFRILDAFPSHKYQSSLGTLQNQFTVGRPVIWLYKDLKTLGFRSCVYVCTCQSALTVGLLVKVGPAVQSLLSSREGVCGSAPAGLGQLTFHTFHSYHLVERCSITVTGTATYTNIETCWW